MNGLVISCLIFSAVFIALFCIGVFIYKKSGWKTAKFYFLFAVIAPLVPYYMDNSVYNEVLAGLITGQGVFIFISLSAWLWRSIAISGNKEDYDSAFSS